MNRPSASPAGSPPGGQPPVGPSAGGSVAAGPAADGRQGLGRRGEDLAATWYADHGYEVLARNWRCRTGELDLIVAQGRLVVFCEVKSRTTDLFGTPAEAVTRAKQTRIRRLAARWLEDEAPARPRAIRFDVACVLDGSVDVMEGAF